MEQTRREKVRLVHPSHRTSDHFRDPHRYKYVSSYGARRTQGPCKWHLFTLDRGPSLLFCVPSGPIVPCMRYAMAGLLPLEGLPPEHVCTAAGATWFDGRWSPSSTGCMLPCNAGPGVDVGGRASRPMATCTSRPAFCLQQQHQQAWKQVGLTPRFSAGFGSLSHR